MPGWGGEAEIIEEAKLGCDQQQSTHECSFHGKTVKPLNLLTDEAHESQVLPLPRQNPVAAFSNTSRP